MIEINRANSRFLRMLFFAFLFVFFPAIVLATAEPYGIGLVAEKSMGTLGAVAKMITAAGFVAGFGFAIAAIFKFKQHKDNPTQIPVGTPIALLFIGAALIFLPSLFTVIGQTLFGTESVAGTVHGAVVVSEKGGKK